jgi:hypothetical protein
MWRDQQRPAVAGGWQVPRMPAAVIHSHDNSYPLFQDFHA